MENQNKHIPSFRTALFRISKQLGESDLESMKFLVAGLPDKPGYADVETAKSVMDFFRLLLKYDNISESNYELLIHLLDEIGQKALIKTFQDLTADTSRHSESDNSVISSAPSPSSVGTSAGNQSPASPDSGIASPDSRNSSPRTNTPTLTNTLPQVTSTPNNNRDAAVLKNQPQSGSKSYQMPHFTPVPLPSSPKPSLSAKQQKPQKNHSRYALDNQSLWSPRVWSQ